MKERIAQVIRTKGLTSQRFAEMMGVQPSNISHILSGRNMPSFDFLYKLLRTYPEIDADWLILGEGTMFRREKEEPQGPANESAVLPLTGGATLFEAPQCVAIAEESTAMGEKPVPAAPSVSQQDVVMESPRSDRSVDVQMQQPESKVYKDVIESVVSTEAAEAIKKEAIPTREIAKEIVSMPSLDSSKRQIEKVLVFFNDKTFAEYHPE